MNSFNLYNKNVNFYDIVNIFKIDDLDNFICYLIEIYKDLSKRSDNPKLGINKLTFNKYYELNGIINDRFFDILDIDHNKYLNVEEFINGIVFLFNGNFSYLCNLIFNFYDFDGDGKINSNDIKLIISYIPLQGRYNRSSKQFLKYENLDEDRIEAEDDLTETLNLIFKEKEYLEKNDFKNVIVNINSDIFMFILIFLLERKPFTFESLDVFKNGLYQFGTRKNFIHLSKGSKSSINKFIVSPSHKSKFSPLYNKRSITRNSLIVIYGTNLKNSDQNSLKNGESNLSNINNFEKQISFNNKNDSNLLNSILKDISNSKDVSNSNQNEEDEIEEENVEDIKNTVIPKRKISKKLHEDNNNNNNDKNGEKNKNEKNDSLIDESSLFNIDEDFLLNKDIYYEGYLYKISKSNKLIQRYFRLIGRDFYYFQNDNSNKFEGLHSICDCFIKDNKIRIIENENFYSFSIIYPYCTRDYYLKDESQYKIWINKLKSAINHFSITDSFEIKEKIGRGKFAIVKLGIHKITGRKVAIKEVQKNGLTVDQLNLLKTEIEIMKICQHPNIIKLYDVIENENYIYIIMEYCSGYDLFNYIEKRNYKLPENRAVEIIYKLCSAVKYIHSFGIVHRDLKPENILMTDESETSDIRLLDFGLSKIIGPNEFCSEPFGTLSYCAPEILLDIPYNHQVDVFAIGVITYLLLCGFLPFDAENNEAEIARKTINENPIYYNFIWKNISFYAKRFVEKCLIKDPKKRITINEALNDLWFKEKYNIKDS